MRKFKLFAIMLSVAVALSFFTGCGANDSKSGENVIAKDTLKTVLENGKIVVGVRAKFPPIGFINPESGNIEGLVIDLINLYAEKLGVKVEFKDVDWSALIPGLLKGDFDIVAAHMTRSIPRTVSIALSDPYLITGTVAILPVKSNVKKYADLNNSNMTIASTEGNVYIKLIQEKFPKANLKIFQSKMEWSEALKTGRIDCVMESAIAASDMFKLYPGEFKLIPEGFYETETYGFAVGYGEWGFKNSIDLFLQEIKLSGKYAELYKKWMNRDWDPDSKLGSI